MFDPWGPAADDTRARVDCLYYMRGYCANGVACPFRHDQAKRLESEMQRARAILDSQRPQSDIDCTYWLRGYCGRGAGCAFRHDPAKQMKLSIDSALPSSGPTEQFVARPTAAPAAPAAVDKPKSSEDASRRVGDDTRGPPRRERDARPRAGDNKRKASPTAPDDGAKRQAARGAPEPRLPDWLSKRLGERSRRPSGDGRAVFNRLGDRPGEGARDTSPKRQHVPQPSVHTGRGELSPKRARHVPPLSAREGRDLQKKVVECTSGLPRLAVAAIVQAASTSALEEGELPGRGGGRRRAAAPDDEKHGQRDRGRHQQHQPARETRPLGVSSTKIPGPADTGAQRTVGPRLAAAKRQVAAAAEQAAQPAATHHVERKRPAAVAVAEPAAPIGNKMQAIRALGAASKQTADGGTPAKPPVFSAPKSRAQIRKEKEAIKGAESAAPAEPSVRQPVSPKQRAPAKQQATAVVATMATAAQPEAAARAAPAPARLAAAAPVAAEDAVHEAQEGNLEDLDFQLDESELVALEEVEDDVDLEVEDFEFEG